MSMEFGFEDSVPSFVVPESITVDEVTVESTSGAFRYAKILAGKKQELSDLEAANADKIARQALIESEIEELNKKRDLLTQERARIREELFDYNRARRSLLREIEDVKKLLQSELENERLAQELRDNRIIFDKRISNFNYHDRILKHQVDGAFILATNMRCILGDKRGAGKTLTSIASWDMAQSQRVLVIVPDDVVGNFTDEIHFWAPHRNVFTIGKMPKIQRNLALDMVKSMSMFTVVVNYSAWRKDSNLLDRLIDLRFDTVVLDEAHQLKDRNSNAFRGVHKIVSAENCCPKCGGSVELKAVSTWTSALFCNSCEWRSDYDTGYEFGDNRSVKMVTPMSGTVILNKPQDLFALLVLVDPINFPLDGESSYLRRYCEQNYYTGRWRFKRGGLESLRHKLSGRYIAREGVKTPKQSITLHDLEITREEYPQQFRVIEQLSKSAQIILDSGKKMKVMWTISLITRKRQANVWPAGIVLKDPDTGDVLFDAGEEITESIKVDKCIHRTHEGEYEGLIPEFTEDGDMDLGSNVVVFSQFKGPLKELERRCQMAGIKAVRFDGDTPEHIKDDVRRDFDRKYREAEGYEPKWQVVLANYKSGGVGLNFTAATETIILDKEWNPGKEDQAFGRTDRLGQTEETNVHILRLTKTIDDWMDALNAEKAAMIDGFETATSDLSDELLNAMKSGDVM